MSDYLPPSAGEAGGFFAGVVALLSLLGGGVAWVFNRRRAAAEAGDIDASANLKRVQAKHIQFEELTETVSLLAERMNAAERDLRECKQREERQSERMNIIETRQKLVATMLRGAWPVDHVIPPDMLELLNRIDAEITARSEHPPRRSQTRGGKAKSKNGAIRP